MLVRRDGRVERCTIGEIVKEHVSCEIVGFDPDSFEVGYHEVTGCYEGPEDRIFEVRLASGRRVRVTAGHNLFTVDRDGSLRKVRTAELAQGVLVAVPRSIPDPPDADAVIDLLRLIPEEAWGGLVLEGATIERAYREEWPTCRDWLNEAGLDPYYWRSRRRLPWVIALAIPFVWGRLGEGDFVRGRGERHRLPVRVQVDGALAWALGMYVAEGYRRKGQVVISNTDQGRLDRIEAIFRRWSIPLHRSAGAVTCCSTLVSHVVHWMGMGGKAPTKRVPTEVFGWPADLVRAFLDGLVDGDGSFDGSRTSVRTTSTELVGDVLLLVARLGRRSGSTLQSTSGLPRWQVYAPDNEHKLLTAVPLPDLLLKELRAASDLTQADAARRAGYRHSTDLDNLEQRRGRDAIRFQTIRRLAGVYEAAGVDVARLRRLVEGGLAWDRVVEVVDTGEWERIYDIEVRPSGHRIENFLAGRGGVFVSNTAGFIDAGWDGHITLELSNVANLPITLYPGMKIGQISFLRMTTPADVPYGAEKLGSKYQGQRGPTPSRYWENFGEDAQ
ncbi:MAG: LAGLIDADG family homing endonuclease [Acidimicrobiales bacterium]